MGGEWRKHFAPLQKITQQLIFYHIMSIVHSWIYCGRFITFIEQFYDFIINFYTHIKNKFDYFSNLVYTLRIKGSWR